MDTVVRILISISAAAVMLAAAADAASQEQVRQCEQGEDQVAYLNRDFYQIPN